MLSSASSTLCDECTILSSTASATVGSPMASYQLPTGSCEDITIAFLPCRSSMISSSIGRSFASIGTRNAITLSDYGACYITNANGSDNSTRTISPTSNSIVKVDAYWYGMSNTGRAFEKGNGIYFRFGNIFVAQNDQDQKHAYGLNGIDNIKSATTFKSSNNYRNYDISTKIFLHIEIEINTATNTLNYLRVSEMMKTTK